MRKIITAFMMMLCVACVASAANYLTFIAEVDSSTFGFVNDRNNPDVQYSLDGGETWTVLVEGDAVTLAHKGDKALLRGNNPDGFSKSLNSHSNFTMTGKIATSGSVMSLVDGVGESEEIPASYCFYGLFRGCTSLTQAPELLATMLSAGCYESMFSGCTSLVQAPELPATRLYSNCYASMFSDCASLTQAPELPAIYLRHCWGCYWGMFSGCTSLTKAPKLPAKKICDRCYAYMFSGCTSLTQAPELPATELNGSYCCSSMFSGCTSLSKINVSFDDWYDSGHGTPNWVDNVAPTGIFICPKDLPFEYGKDRIPEGWTVEYVGDTVAIEPNYLAFTAEKSGSTFGIMYDQLNPDIQYSLDDGETWTSLAVGDIITLAQEGDKALIRGFNPDGLQSTKKDYVHFVMTGAIAASGSVMSLIDGVGIKKKIFASCCFYGLFIGCASLTQAPELPATTLATECYSKMFKNCTNLTKAPELPATILEQMCYASMFFGCKSLIKAPALPATIIDEGLCYNSMFENCTSLTDAPELPATIFEWYTYDCYSRMFSGCTSLTQAPELPAKTLCNSCYAFMFSDCTSLTQTPELPAKTLCNSCYESMFSGCTSLVQAPELPATTLSERCYSNMFTGTSLRQAPVLPATVLAKKCYEGMFAVCDSLTQAPNLPATILAEDCFSRMFSSCTYISEMSVSFEDWADSLNSTIFWVDNVAPTGTFYCPKALPLEYGENRIPEGWTVKYIEDGSGVNTTLVDNISVWSDDLTVYVRGAEGEVSLYDMSGRIVATSNSKDEERALCVPAKGAYVVRTSGGERSVLVR